MLVHVLTVIDGTSEELLDLVELKNFDLSAFALQFDVPDSDPEMLDKYAIGPDDKGFLEERLGFPLQLDFTRFAYFIEAARKAK